MKKILFSFGTRPEAIKMAPLYKRIKADPYFDVKLVVTAQHREMLDQVLELFDIVPDFDLNIMKASQSLSDITSTILKELGNILESYQPNIVLVHGDTSTTFASALAAYYKKIPVGHIEAGLRTGNIYSPWPEEANRKLTAQITSLHFAPTEVSRNNLLNEGFDPASIFVVGNTVIDALIETKDKLENNYALRKKIHNSFSFLEDNKKIILVTGHRRENFGSGFINICNALKEVANKNKNINIIYPVHLNPNVQKPVHEILKDQKNIYLIPPQEYLPFVYLMMKSHFILTDSGGIQEEAPSLGKPVLVMRDTSERPEAIESGTAKLVGSDTNSIIKNIQDIIDNDIIYKKMSSSHNPYGDGISSSKICIHLKNNL